MSFAEKMARAAEQDARYFETLLDEFAAAVRAAASAHEMSHGMIEADRRVTYAEEALRLFAKADALTIRLLTPTHSDPAPWQSDVGAILRALGRSDAASSRSCSRIVAEDILPAISALRGPRKRHLGHCPAHPTNAECICEPVPGRFPEAALNALDAQRPEEAQLKV